MKKNGNGPMALPGILFFISFLLFAAPFFEAAPKDRQPHLSFIVSMERPHTHYFQVTLEIDGLVAEHISLKLPNWTPGYYRIMDYARHVINFRAADESGKPLAWEKTAKNIWGVKTEKATHVTIKYDVYAFNVSVAESFLDDSRAFLVPASLFMYPDGYLQLPIKIKINPSDAFPRIFTGLDMAPEEPNTFFAPDFDVLYDCPIYLGNPEVLTFEVDGIPHVIAAEDLGRVDRSALIADLEKIAQGAVAIIGDLPYRHYTFILMDGGRGGLEHLNSMAAYMNAASLQTPEGYKNWLAFLAHEYFHHYNVKRIRPIALGPFDYDRENYTRLLWVAEGITVYYEYIILKRAGLLSAEEFLDRLSSTIARYENVPGSKVQSATESSFDTWIRFFYRSEESANISISYYDKGAVLGLLLDLKIRHQSRNQRSLDDVMRLLYRKYYQGKKRGWTDAEFRAECEAMAGSSLAEIFEDYAATVKDIDYPKYLSYAGLEIDTSWHELSGVDMGITTQAAEGNLIVTSVSSGSSAQEAGLSAKDEIIALNGVRVSPGHFESLLSAHGPGEKVRLLISRRNKIRELDVTLAPKRERKFRIKADSRPGKLEADILQSWLGEKLTN